LVRNSKVTHIITVTKLSLLMTFMKSYAVYCENQLCLLCNKRCLLVSNETIYTVKRNVCRITENNKRIEFCFRNVSFTEFMTALHFLIM
jgi:hypothetical protein